MSSSDAFRCTLPTIVPNTETWISEIKMLMYLWNQVRTKERREIMSHSHGREETRNIRWQQRQREQNREMNRNRLEHHPQGEHSGQDYDRASRESLGK